MVREMGAGRTAQLMALSSKRSRGSFLRTKPRCHAPRAASCMAHMRAGAARARGGAPDVRGTLDADLVAVVALDGVAHKVPERAWQQVHAHPVACAPRRA